MWSQEFADANDMSFFETSAKEGRNVEAAFLRLTRDILQRVSQSALKDPSKNNHKSSTMKCADTHKKSKELIMGQKCEIM